MRAARIWNLWGYPNLARQTLSLCVTRAITNASIAHCNGSEISTCTNNHVRPDARLLAVAVRSARGTNECCNTLKLQLRVIAHSRVARTSAKKTTKAASQKHTWHSEAPFTTPWESELHGVDHAASAIGKPHRRAAPRTNTVNNVIPHIAKYYNCQRKAPDT